MLTAIKKTEVLGKDFTIYGTFEEPMFLAKDVAEWIEHSNARMMLSSVDEEDKQCVKNPYALKGQQEQWFLTENGLYEVLMLSRKPIAKQFKKAVKKILHEIRMTGGFNVPKTYGEALMLAAQQQEQIEKLTLANKEMQPKAKYFDALVERNLLTNFRDTANQLGAKQNTFIDLLLSHKYIYRDKNGEIRPYSQYVNKLFELKDYRSENGKHVGIQTLITPRGKETFRLLLENIHIVHE